MAYKIKMPKFGETMEEGTITNWYVDEGDEIERGEPLFEIETDKSVLDVESEYEGVLLKKVAEEYDSIPIGEVVAIIGEKGEEVSLAVEEEKPQDVAPQEESKSAEKPEAAPVGFESDKIRATPAARRIAHEQGMPLSAIGTSRADAIHAADVRAYADNYRAVAGPETERLPLTGMRRIIAEKMTQSYQEAPHVTLTAKVDMTRVIDLRKQLLAKVEERITYTDIIAMFAAKALQEHREINAHFVNDELIMHKGVHLGIAVDLGHGLIVPVIRNAESLGVGEMADQRKKVVDRARAGQLLPDETAGSTFTISNLGNYDISIFTPIINPPEVAILGVGIIEDEPVVVEKQVEIRSVMWASLSFDHRAVDGASAARFLQRLKELLEEPGMLIL